MMADDGNDAQQEIDDIGDKNTGKGALGERMEIEGCLFLNEPHSAIAEICDDQTV